MEISLNYDYSFKINTTPSAQSPSMAEIKKGFDNVSEALNEVLYQASFLGDSGYGSSYVTGGQLIVTLSGVRMIGDTAQDYIFSDSVYYNWGKSRETTIEMTCPDGTVITCPVTLAKISRSGGAANNGTAISVEIHFNGKPTIINTNLSALSIGGLTLTPTFSGSITTYTASTTNASDAITATAEDTTNATVAIKNGNTTVVSGASATWSEGDNVVTITVTNSTQTKVYTVTVEYDAL